VVLTCANGQFLVIEEPVVIGLWNLQRLEPRTR